MDVLQFGRALIDTGDLDPVYIGIYQAKLDEPQLCRLLLAYWCFYHLGAASYLSEFEGRDYWDFMLVAAKNSDPDMEPRVLLGNVGNRHERWPRASERRHFRGDKCVNAVAWLSHGVSAEFRVRALANECRTERDVATALDLWPQFGPWISFKVADMLERCYGAPIAFHEDTGLMYESPRAGLELVDSRDPEATYRRLLAAFSNKAAPPSRDRPCGPQEVETILCKFKSMSDRHYWVGKDIQEVRHGLEGWGQTADRVLSGMPPLVINGSH